MIKTYKMLVLELENTYKSPQDKVIRMNENGEIIKLTKGLYETDMKTPPYVIANIICNPSYLSFDYALSYHGLIPERVYLYTCASFKKNKKKEYSNKFGDFQYKRIPAKAYPYEILMIEENEYYYWIASAEKALCDKLYDLKPVNNKKELMELLFQDLRVDEVKKDVEPFLVDKSSLEIWSKEFFLQITKELKRK